MAQDTRSRVPRLTRDGDFESSIVLAESRTALWSEANALERTLERGKVQNLRIAAKRLDGLVIPRGEVFSFWKNLGLCTRFRGFVPGRQLQEGCLIPAIGGGLCQLSNALYDVALRAGCEIVERHPHTRIVPGSIAEAGRDATVAWNYIDLRFRHGQPMKLEVRLSQDSLLVTLRGQSGLVQLSNHSRARPTSGSTIANSCASCGETECFRHPQAHTLTTSVKKAFLLDSATPEFASFVRSIADSDDVISVPARSERYAWPLDVFGKVDTHTLWTLVRSLQFRRLASQGPQRRAFELTAAANLALRSARTLDPDVDEVVVDLKLLPHLLREGVLGGRTYSVLLTRWPMAEIQNQLDRAASANPGQKLLSDFRADPGLVELEEKALKSATRIVTPHRWLAKRFGDRTHLLSWQESKPLEWQPGPAFAFVGPVAARKGAYAFRELARELKCPVVVIGSELEGANFWDGIEVRHATRLDWLMGVRAVVAPAFVEDQPRLLLQALQAGVPVFASEFCGLPDHANLTVVDPFQVDGMIETVRAGLG